MDNKIYKYIKWLLLAMMVIGVAVFIYFLVTSMMNPEQSSQFSVGTVGGAKGVGVMLLYTYALVAISIIVALLFPLLNIFRNPKAAVRSLIGLGLMVVILGVAYVFSKDTPVPNPSGGLFDNSMMLRISDVGLYVTYLMVIVAFLVIIFGEIRGAFKK